MITFTIDEIEAKNIILAAITSQSLVLQRVDLLAAQVLDIREIIMANFQQVQDAIAAEAAQVQAKLAAVAVEMQALRDQIAGGAAATPAQLDELIVAVQNIFTPDPVPPAPVPTP